MYSYGPPQMALQKQDNQHEHTFCSYVRIRDVVLKTYLGRGMIGRSGERGSGISVLPARHDDDDIYIYTHTHIYIYIQTDTYINTHTHARTHRHTHTHKYIYIYIYIYKFTFQSDVCAYSMKFRLMVILLIIWYFLSHWSVLLERLRAHYNANFSHLYIYIYNSQLADQTRIILPLFFQYFFSYIKNLFYTVSFSSYFQDWNRMCFLTELKKIFHQ